MLVMGFLGQLVSDWARGAQLRRYSVKFIKIVWPGDTVVCKGRVTDRYGDQGRYYAEIDLWAENQKGELVMKGQATIQVFFSLEDETRQRSGQPPIMVSVPRESLMAAQANAQAEQSRPAQPERKVAAGTKTAAKSPPAARSATVSDKK
jgi:hypothetical protein